MNTLYLEKREKECFSRLQRLVRKVGITNPTIFDVGANIGQSIEHFRGVWPEAPIHSFEPNPDVFSRLAATWGNKSGVSVQQLALSDRAGSVPFHATRVPEVASLHSPTKRLQQISSESKYDYRLITVRTDTLDHYCQSSDITSIDVLKIDVQGGEYSVLKGAQALLEAAAIGFIYLETTFAECYDGQTDFAELLSLLKTTGTGYVLWDMVPFLYTGCDRLWAANSILVSRNIGQTLEA